MKLARAAAFFLAFALAAAPVRAQDYLLGSLIPHNEKASPAKPRVLFTGLYGERYAVLPDRQYFILPPQDCAIPQPVVETTSAGTYRYRYTAGREGIYDANSMAVLALIDSFEMKDGGTNSAGFASSASIGPVVGAYDQKEAKRMFLLLNKARQEAGLPVLSWDASLAGAARWRAGKLALDRSLGWPDGASERATESDGENYLYGYETADIAMARMLELPGRRENILSKKFVTAATASFESDQCKYWVVEFGREPGVSSAATVSADDYVCFEPLSDKGARTKAEKQRLSTDTLCRRLEEMLENSALAEKATVSFTDSGTQRTAQVRLTAKTAPDETQREAIRSLVKAAAGAANVEILVNS